MDDAPNQPDIAYCQISPVVAGSDGISPTAQVTGFIMRPDGSLIPMGTGTGSYQFTVNLPFRYGTSVAVLADEVIPAIQQGYSMPGLSAQVEFVPFV